MVSNLPGPASDSTNPLAPVRAPFWTASRRRLYTLIASAGTIFAVSSSISDWRDNHTILINTSPSLPNWAFVLDKTQPPERGALVFFSPPLSPLVVAHFGAHPDVFGKRVYGVCGDVVTQKGRTFFVNGHRVATAKWTSSRGEPLEPGPTGVIPRGCYFVGSPHKDGFDSRYAAIGWICMHQIFGTGTAIL